MSAPVQTVVQIACTHRGEPADFVANISLGSLTAATAHIPDEIRSFFDHIKQEQQ
jgi:hypothetical protein